MRKVFDALDTLRKALLYSFRFCWRNSRTATMVRLAFSVITPVISYLVFLSSGLVFNAVQRSYGKLGNEKGFDAVVHSGVLGPVALLIGIILVGSVLGQIHWFYRNYWNQSLRYANTDEVQRHCASLDVATFQGKEFDTITRRIDELPQGRMTRIGYADEAFSLVSSMVSFTFFGASVLWYSPLFALILLVASLPMMIGAFNLTARWWVLYESLIPHHKKRNVLSRAFVEDTAFAQASMFNQHDVLSVQVTENVHQVMGLYDRIRKLCVQKNLLSNTVTIIGLGVVVLWAVYDTLITGGKIGTLTVVIGSARTFQSSLEMIVSSLADQWNSAKGVILIEEEFFATKSRIVTLDPITPNFTHPDIRFDRVEYSYPEQKKPALNGTTFDIHHGEIVAILGENGAGKSTVIEMLLRRRDPDVGSVYFSGVNARNIEPKVLHEYVTALTQKHRILERLIAEEVASSRLDKPVDLERVSLVSGYSRFDSVVDKCDDKFNTQIGSAFGGKEFSGGESQRLAIARMLYRDTPVIIFDEPEASLDKDTGEHLMNILLSMTDKTVIIVTHNVARAERCQKVIVMSAGKAIEQGTPSELMARGGEYSRLVRGAEEAQLVEMIEA